MTLVAPMFAGSTVAISVRYSSVVNGAQVFEPLLVGDALGVVDPGLAPRLGDVQRVPVGWRGRRRLRGVILVGRLLVACGRRGVLVVPPGVVAGGAVLLVVSAAAPPVGRSFEPVSWGTMMPAAMTTTATTNTTIARWRGERMGQPHRRR